MKKDIKERRLGVRLSDIKTATDEYVLSDAIYSAIKRYKSYFGLFPMLLMLVTIFSFGVNISTSMEPTIIEGDSSVIFPWIHEIKRGDIVGITQDGTPKGHYYSKRVIGIPGDTIEFYNGEVYINFKLLDEPYIKGKTFYRKKEGKDKVSITLSNDGYFVMGDNRENSFDSRSYGEFKREEIKGKVILIIPIGKIKSLIFERWGFYFC